jgi:3-oxosteroid 1-dehydrogenase
MPDPSELEPSMQEAERTGSRVSRRDFLKAGGAGAAASALGVTTLSATAAQAAFRSGRDADVVIVGSGAAAAVAAITARSCGARVTMLERSPVFGGTSAKSAGMFWVPNNFHMKELGLADPREPFIAYCARYSYPQVYDPKSPTMGLPKSVYELIAAFYDNGSLMIDALRGMKALRVGRYHILPESEAQDLPDYFEHAEENKAPRGRGLGALKLDGSLGFGDELMGQLKAKLDELQVPVLVSHRVNRLLLNSRGEAIGVEATHGDKTVSIRARRAVIFGTGGYTYNKELLQSHQAGPVYGGCGVPTCTGDFIPIATAAGAKLGNMGGAWRAQIVLEEALQYISVPNDVWQRLRATAWSSSTSTVIASSTRSATITTARAFSITTTRTRRSSRTSSPSWFTTSGQLISTVAIIRFRRRRRAFRTSSRAIRWRASERPSSSASKSLQTRQAISGSMPNSRSNWRRRSSASIASPKQARTRISSAGTTSTTASS